MTGISPGALRPPFLFHSSFFWWRSCPPPPRRLGFAKYSDFANRCGAATLKSKQNHFFLVAACPALASVLYARPLAAATSNSQNTAFCKKIPSKFFSSQQSGEIYRSGSARIGSLALAALCAALNVRRAGSFRLSVSRGW